MITSVQLGEEIRAVRKKHRLTLEQAAKLAGVTGRTWIDIEHGVRYPKTDTLLNFLTSVGEPIGSVGL